MLQLCSNTLNARDHVHAFRSSIQTALLTEAFCNLRTVNATPSNEMYALSAQ